MVGQCCFTFALYIVIRVAASRAHTTAAQWARASVRSMGEPDAGKLKGSHLDVGVLGQLVCAGETGRASTDDDDVGLGILVQVLEVAAGHGAAHLQVCASRHHLGSARFEGLAGPVLISLDDTVYMTD